MKRKHMLPEVTREIEFLRKELTAEEKEQLVFNQLDPRHKSECIYGQATGNCYSKRAADLINSLKIIYYLNNLDKGVREKVVSNDNVIKKRKSSLRLAFTPLEYFIANYPNKNRHILQYIKKKVDTLDL